MYDWTSEGDLYPSVELPIYYENTGEEVSFVLYDHTNGIEYSSFTVFAYGDPETLLTLHTGEYHDELYFGPDEAIVLSFTDGFTKEINGYVYSEGNDNYYLIASPVGDISAGAVGSLVSNSFDFYSFNQSAASEEWVNLVGTAEEYEMQIGVGYLYANSDTVTLVFTGTPIDPEEEAEYPIVLDYDTDCTTEWQGYNLIGNPYGEPAFLNREFLRLVDGEYQVEYNYEEVAVEAMEGVFVQAEDEDDVVTFSLMAGGGGLTPGKCVLNVTEGRGLVDRAVIRFGEGHQMTKVQFNSSHSKLYIPQDGKDYAVVRSAEMGELCRRIVRECRCECVISAVTCDVDFNFHIFILCKN